MSHFAALVLIESEAADDAESRVQELLAPFDEKWHTGGRWDWWVIGGRWNGCLTGYNPDADERNYESCKHCTGTGSRTDMKPPAGAWAKHDNGPFKVREGAIGCNGCGGTGMRRLWTDAVDGGNIVPVSDLPSDFLPLALVVPRDGSEAELDATIVSPVSCWYESFRMFSWEEDADWPKKYAEVLLVRSDYTAVVVDCHV